MFMRRSNRALAAVARGAALPSHRCDPGGGGPSGSGVRQARRLRAGPVPRHQHQHNMDTGSWKTDSAGHAYYIYTKTSSNVSMNHNYYKILCSDSWAGQCRFQDF